MKKCVLLFSAFVGIILVLLFLIPFLFKGDILQLVETHISRHIKAELKIGDMSLSMFRSFPDLNVTLEEVSLIGRERFSGDTLLNIPRIEASVNLKSLLSGKEVVVNRFLLKDCRLNLITDTAGYKNWDVLIQDNTGTSASGVFVPAEEKGPAGKSLQLSDIRIENLFVNDLDYQNSTYFHMEHLDLKLKGNFSERSTLADLSLSVKDISLRHRNSVWLNKVGLDWRAIIKADLQDLVFEIEKNDLTMNDLKLNLTGNLVVFPDKYRMDLQLDSPETQFESLLALVPKAFRECIQDLKTNGDFKLNATVKGDYYTGHWPAFQVNLQVNGAMIQYPGLPESVQNINMDLNMTHPGGPVDSMQINLKKMSFAIADNPFNLFLYIRNPHDPQLNGGAVGTLNFANLKKALPLKEVRLEGVVNTDVTFKGMYKDIENEQYEKFVAKGNLDFKDILFVNSMFPEGFSIPRGQILITPASLKLNQFQANVFSSDFVLQGDLSGYLPYVFKNGILKGDFSLNSTKVNLNEFIIAQMQTARKDTVSMASRTSQRGTPVTEGALEIPENIDIHFTTQIHTLLFDRLTVKNVKGRVGLANAVATLKNLSMDMLDGNMVMNGWYNTRDPRTPEVDFNLQVNHFDIHEAYEAFTFIRQSIPIAMNCNGRISASMKFSSQLDQAMSPVMTTANGSGYVESQGILLKDNPAMNQLASVLKNEELSRLSISHLKIDFKLENGNIKVEPFKTTFAGNPVTIYGTQTAGGQLDYTLSMTVRREYFGSDINNLLKSIPGSGNIESLDLDAKVEGTLTKPVIKPDLSKAIKRVTKEAEKELKGNLLDGLQNLFKKKK